MLCFYTFPWFEIFFCDKFTQLLMLRYFYDQLMSRFSVRQMDWCQGIAVKDTSHFSIDKDVVNNTWYMTCKLKYAEFWWILMLYCYASLWHFSVLVVRMRSYLLTYIDIIKWILVYSLFIVYSLWLVWQADFWWNFNGLF